MLSLRMIDKNSTTHWRQVNVVGYSGVLRKRNNVSCCSALEYDMRDFRDWASVGLRNSWPDLAEFTNMTRNRQ